MQQELTTINTKIAIVRESQLALTTLMEGISTRLDTVAKPEPPLKEYVDVGAERLAKAWDLNVLWCALTTNREIVYDS